MASARTFRLFVSSTFSDLREERNALQERVFPRLRALCAAHGCRFQAIDLRWGVSDEAALDQQTMRICLGEVARCQRTSPRPNFLILLGDRYGWRPLPEKIPAPEHALLDPLLTGEERVLLARWYRRDDNAMPPVYCLQPRTAGFETSDSWEAVEQRLHAALERAANSLPFSADERLKYTASATEQEIVAGALSVADAPQHVHAYFREIVGPPSDARAAAYTDLDPAARPEAEDTHRLAGLKERLTRALPGHRLAQRAGSPGDGALHGRVGRPEGGAASQLASLKERLAQALPGQVHTYRARWMGDGPTLDHLDGLCQEVYRHLAAVIEAEIDALEEADPLSREVAAHAEFGRDRARDFVGRRVELDCVAAYLESGRLHPFAVSGPPGSGKSALMARAAHLACEAHPRAQVIARFVGATPESSSVRLLLEGLCRAMACTGWGDERSIPAGYEELVKELPRRLALTTPDRPLVLFLDSLDQLSAADGAHRLAWLPADLPPHVRIVVSSTPGDCRAALEARLPAEQFCELAPLPEADARALLASWLAQKSRSLQPIQESAILTRFGGCGLPLYLKFCFEEARHWRSYDPAPDLSSDVPGMVRQLLSRLSRENHHGAVLVARSLGYLSAARNGLSEDELLDVLSADREVIADFLSRSPRSPRVDRLPAVVWSRLLAELEPYLAERSADGASMLGYYHRQVGEVVAEEYLSEEDGCRRHEALAAYFAAQPLRLESATDGGTSANLRKLSEQAYQQAHAGLGAAWVATLTDMEFLHGRVGHGGVLPLVEDYDLGSVPALASDEVARAAAPGLALIQGALRLSAQALAQDANQLPGQLLGRLLEYPHPDVQALLAGARAWRGGGWLRPVTASLSAPGGPLIATLVGHVYHVMVAGVAVTPDSRLAVSAGADATVHVWDLSGLAQRHVLKEMAAARVALLPDGRHALVGARPMHDDSSLPLLTLWDLESGELVRFLKGHRGDVTALALTGDGSLAVAGSSDGTAAICDLASGEARHVLQTGPVRALAISPDGRHVAVLSKAELKTAFSQDGMYEFIVPGQRPGLETRASIWHLAEGRELASLAPAGSADRMLLSLDGTLLILAGAGGIQVWDWVRGAEEPRWSGPSAAATALALHPDGRQLLSGAKDGSLHVWDLVTGQPLLTLTGHTAEVKVLAVDKAGRHALSGSDDGTVRVWDLEQGNLVGVLEGHTEPVTALVLTPDEERAVSGSKDYSLKVWDWRRAILARSRRSQHPAPVSAVALSSDGSRGFSAAQGGGITAWDVRGAEGAFSSTAPSTVTSLRTLADAQVWACCEDGSFAGWDLAGGAPLPGGRTARGRHQAIIDSPDGWRVYVVEAEAIAAYEPESGTRVGALEAADGLSRVWQLVATPDGARIAAASWGGGLKVWDGRTGRLHHHLAHPSPLLCADLTPDGRMALAGSSRGELLLWDLERGRLIASWRGYQGAGDTQWVRSVALAHDASLAVSAANDGVIKVWQPASGSLLAAFTGQSQVVRCALSADGRTVIAGETSGRVHLLRLEV